MKARLTPVVLALVVASLATHASASKRQERTERSEAQHTQQQQGKDGERCNRPPPKRDGWISRTGQWLKENVRGIPPEKPAQGKPGRP
jgi:hypothetical protein